MKKEIIIKVGGMSCVVCSAAVEKAIHKLCGISACTVNFASGDAKVTFDDALSSREIIEQAIIDAGFDVIKQAELEVSDDTTYLIDKKNMVVGWIFTAPLMIIMLYCMVSSFPAMPKSFMQAYHIVAIAFSLVVFILPGKKTIMSAIKSTRNLAPNMDVLITLGGGAAFLTAFLPGMWGHHSFVEIGAMIFAIHLTGRYIENKTKGKTSEAIRKLIELGAKSAHTLRDGQIVEVSISDINLGEILVIKPGSKVPTDAVIIDGDSYIDESMATGESMPVYKKKGDHILGGTINGNGSLQAQVTKVGKDTFLSQMIQLIEHAQNTKVPVQAYADKVTGFFVPFIILMAIITFLVHLMFPYLREDIVGVLPINIPWMLSGVDSWVQALFCAITVLVIACPCALGLATPTAIMAGLGLGTKYGILIRNGEAVETIKSAKTIIFDKTGTLTLGKPMVTDLLVFSENERDIIFQGIYTLESLSDHPLAKAIVGKLASDSLQMAQVTDFQSISGKGITGTINGESWLLGSINFMRESGADIGDKEQIIQQLQREAKTTVLIAKNNVLVSVIAICDEIKPDSALTIKTLHQMSIDTVMLTGDNEMTAREVAGQLGIGEVYANVLPEDKLNHILRFQKQGKKVIMVGDGINDAPALKQADVSIAIGGGTDIAIESADLVLVKNEVSSVVKAINLSNSIFRVIKQNLFWAFIYNAIAIPLAFCGFLHPVIAEIAMALSSITVVANANRLRNVKL